MEVGESYDIKLKLRALIFNFESNEKLFPSILKEAFLFLVLPEIYIFSKISNFWQK